MHMSTTIHNRRQASAWLRRFDPQAPKGGDIAPDFALGDPSGERTVRLSDFRGDRPAALVFGSFT
jgi:hypothetical protein